MKRNFSTMNEKTSFINDEPNNPSPNFPVSDTLAKLIEDSVTKTNLSININSTTVGTHT